MSRAIRSLISLTVPVAGALALAVGSLSITRPPGPKLVALAPHVPASLDGAGVGIGPSSGAVTVRVVGDYECSACEALERTIGEDLRNWASEGRIRYQLVQAPLPAHRRASKAATALFCAERQGDPWGMHQLLVAGRADWGWGDDPNDAFQRYARDLGLSPRQFTECLGSPYARLRLEADREAASRVGVASVPAIFVDASLVTPSRSFREVLSVVEALLAEGNPSRRPHAERGPRAVPPDHSAARPRP